MLTKRLVTTVVLGLILVALAGAPAGAQLIPMLVNGASLSLSPSNPSVQAGDIFTMEIVAEIGVNNADTVDAYLDFDPTYLEVVDGSGTPVSKIEPNEDMFDFVSVNSVDNAAGKINFSATNLGASLTGTFTAATIRFRAKAAVDSTDVVFVQSGARWSELYLSGEPLNATLENGTVTISDGSEADLTIVKDASPPDGTDFVFAGDLGAFTLDDAVPDDGDTVSDTITFADLLPGTFTITETVPAGWQLTNIVCQDPDSGTTTSGNSATIDLDAGEHITCTFTNTGPPTATTVTIGSGGVAPGEYITVPLEALSVVDLASVEIEIQYDPDVLNFITCNPDPGSIFDLEVCEEFNNDGVPPDAIRFTSISAAGVSGDIVLAEITLEAVGQPEDSSVLNVEVVTLDNALGIPISHSVKNGRIDILLRGDVNCDGIVNSTDALFILQYFVGLRIPWYTCLLPPPPPDTLYLPACDVNGDGKCNSTDALFILQCFVGISNPLCPCSLS